MDEKKYDLDGFALVRLLQTKKETLKERLRVGQINESRYSYELEKIADQIDEILRTN